jgi:hypothetical protein
MLIQNPLSFRTIVVRVSFRHATFFCFALCNSFRTCASYDTRLTIKLFHPAFFHWFFYLRFGACFRSHRLRDPIDLHAHPDGVTRVTPCHLTLCGSWTSPACIT